MLLKLLEAEHHIVRPGAMSREAAPATEQLALFASVPHPLVEKLRGWLMEAGRAPEDFGLEARLPLSEDNSDGWQKAIDDWLALGATHFSINTMRRGFTNPQAHLEALATFANAMPLG